MAHLTRTETGYATKDGRWTVEPAVMGSGVTGWAGGRGWSQGRREWVLTDTTGKIRLGVGGSRTIVQAVWRARDIIDAYAA